ncbi:hypothetical protein [Sphingomonas phyllosphaerae]|uniref:hypothetical protein n=1 Tax=Sphingomonas phyllosphaerae TaxID=257003 RepID=UPI002413A73D|nr:hypothetical protein [Sphingomonas phyllosphaerae]
MCSATIAALTTAFRLVPVVVALFFAGELFWAEREHKVEPIITATPVGGAVSFRQVPRAGAGAAFVGGGERRSGSGNGVGHEALARATRLPDVVRASPDI